MKLHCGATEADVNGIAGKIHPERREGFGRRLVWFAAPSAREAHSPGI